MKFVANDTVLGQTLAEARGMARHWRLWLGLLGAALVVGLTGPFGTYGAMPLPVRLGYWVVVVVLSFWLGFLTSFLTACWAEGLGAAAPWSVGLGAIAASLALSVCLAGLHAAVMAEPFAGEVLRLLPYVLVITAVVAFLFETVEVGGRPGNHGPAPPLEPAWLDRLPTALGRQLILLQAQDHYVRAETPLGETLLRGTISDAEAELGDLGVRVHRSWWVSRTAIRSVQTRNGAPVIVLTTGQEVPLGRSYRRRVRDLIR